QARRFLAVADVADVLGITPAAVAELLESGELRGLRVRGAWRIADDEVQAWIDRELELERRRGCGARRRRRASPTSSEGAEGHGRARRQGNRTQSNARKGTIRHERTVPSRGGRPGSCSARSR